MKRINLPVTGWLAAAIAVTFFAACRKATYEFPPEPLRVVSVKPSDAEGDVADDTIVEVRFSRAPDPATVNPATFRLVDESTDTPVDGEIVGVEETSGGAPTLYRLIPADRLLAGHHPYRVELAEEIATLDGASLDLLASRDLFAVSIPCHFTTCAEPDTEPPHFYHYELRAIPVGPTVIDLSWFPAHDDTVTWDRLTYEIYVSPDSEPFDPERPWLETSPGAFSYSVGGLTPDTEYAFVIRALDEARNRSYWDESYVATARTLLAAEETELTILYTADVFATLEPCG